MTMKNRILLCAILISGASFSCAPPELVIPKIQYKTTSQLHNEMPDCRLEINAALDNPTKENNLDAFFCYTQSLIYWENEYNLVEIQLNGLYENE